MNSVKDVQYMQRALELALRAQGRTSPNPMVGAVLVKNDQIIGEGYHHQAGTPHAEVNALRAAGEDVAGATMYVSLEPCSHQGRTPPCADAVVAAGIARVVIASMDPNPLVSGRGLKILQDAGIVTTVGVLQQEADRINEPFFKYIQTRKPYISLKTAMTLDGKIATATGDSRWISSETSRRYVHHLRNIHDAILVGIGTVLKDDPLLNTRLDEPDTRNPVRIVIDTYLDLPLTSKIVKSAGEIETMVFCSPQANRTKIEILQQQGLSVIAVPAADGKIVLEDVFTVLAEKGIMTLLIEGGGEINGYLIEKNLIDKVYWFIAPKIVGGRDAPAPVGGIGIPELKNALRLKEPDITLFGNDIMITGYLNRYPE